MPYRLLTAKYKALVNAAFQIVTIYIIFPWICYHKPVEFHKGFDLQLLILLHIVIVIHRCKTIITSQATAMKVHQKFKYSVLVVPEFVTEQLKLCLQIFFANVSSSEPK